MLARPAVATDLPAIQKILVECDLAADMDLTEFSGICVVAVHGGEVVGFAQAIPAKPVAVFTLLGVLPAYRHTRAAYALSEATELLLRVAGCKSWTAFANADADRWIRTMTKWGAEKCSNAGYLLRKEFNR